MTNKINLSGNGTLIMKYAEETYRFENFASGDFITLEMAGDFTTRTAFGNGGSGVVRNFTGSQATMTVKVTAGSNDDKFFMRIYKDFQNNFPSNGFISGEWNLLSTDSLGQSVQSKHKLTGGSITQTPVFSASSDGNIAVLERPWVLGFTIELQTQ
tara:strand:+ start:5793 stop:6260 length:468 start_codon:yes stop_codon:yes gene_type:complete